METQKSYETYARYKRFNVIGTSSSGKSTFSRKLAETLSRPYVELDQVYWKPNWENINDEELFEQVSEITDRDCWVLDGNYSRTTPIKWSKAECVVWLDHSFSVNVYRAVTRAISRAVTQQELWPGTGNRESFRLSFLSKDSVLLWTLRTYYRNKKRYSLAMRDRQYEHLDFVRLRSQKEVDEFLNAIGRAWGRSLSL